jgi:hypothetical protein
VEGRIVKGWKVGGRSIISLFGTTTKRQWKESYVKPHAKKRFLSDMDGKGAGIVEAGIG